MKKFDMCFLVDEDLKSEVRDIYNEIIELEQNINVNKERKILTSTYLLIFD